ncbi:MAG: nucleotidyl transferase AbiEii/AbiGii toxin family protein [Bacilli bacterium]|nr:nucleotidyl transferase AbiEii/AbiGii toxin family protein [Bacilli bacterium]
MNIEHIINNYLGLGYETNDVESKASQDIILSKISKSKFKNHITIKGGVVMHSISNDKRRATRDLDLDFIKYSLEDKSILDFINILNSVDDGIYIEVVGRITPLHHQDYNGKRVFIKIKDNYNNEIDTKLDIGVHKLFEIEQDDYCFKLDALNENVSLLINSMEQMFTEKLKSLLRLGARSTRYKDLFDFYYLINECDLDKNKLIKTFNIYIYNDQNMRENNIHDIYHRLSKILNSRIYKNNLNNPKVNWLDISVNSAIQAVLKYIEELSEEVITA